MNTEVETLKQEFEEIQNTLLPKDETKTEEAFYKSFKDKYLVEPKAVKGIVNGI